MVTVTRADTAEYRDKEALLTPHKGRRESPRQADEEEAEGPLGR